MKRIHATRTIFLCLVLGTLLLAVGTLMPANSEAAVGSWSSNGPVLFPWNWGTGSNPYGQILSLALPSNFGAQPKILAGAQSGHIYMSNDGGATWSATYMQDIGSGGNAWQLTALAIAPDNQTVFAGSSNGYRMFKSSDCGQTWTQLPTPINAWWCYAISPNYSSDQTIFVSTNSAVYVSTNGGNSWTARNAGLPSASCLSLVISPNYTVDKTLFGGTSGRGVYRWDDSTQTWIAKNNGLPATDTYSGPSIDAMAISPNFSQDNTLFAAVWTKGIFKSTDRGENWTRVTDAVYWTASYGIAISPDYANDGKVVVSGGKYQNVTLVSSDGGLTWQGLPSLPAEVYTPYPVTFSPNFASDQTIYLGVSALAVDNGVPTGNKGVYSYTFGPSPNLPPTANAGPDQTKHVGQLVTLDGSLSTDPDGDAITFSWSLTRPDGSTATLSDPTAAKPTFTLDQPGLYRLSLVVTDAKDAVSAPDEVIINTSNSAPVANAGPDQSFDGIGMTVTLDGSKSSDPDQDGITYQWTMTTKPPDSNAQLSGADTVSPSFVVDKHGDYIISLIVKDTWEAPSNTATVKVSSNNLKPVANAGDPQTVHVGALVTLNGSASDDPDQNYPLTYAWSFTTTPVGDIPLIAGANKPSPTFTPNKEGSYSLQLIVTDSLNLASNPATVTISTKNSTPIANAGANQVLTEINKTVTLDGTASYDPDRGDKLSYNWSLTSKPPGSTATLNGTTPSTTFVPDVQGPYVAQLTVTDPCGASSTATVTVSFTNIPPEASAGPNQAVQVIGATVNLNGSSSYDENGDSLTFTWSLSAKPSGSNAQIIPDPDDPSKASFVVDLHGEYVAKLMVKDPLDASSTAQATISFNNLPPVADAGASQSVKVGDTVTLDGSKSSDPNGDTLTHAWSITSRPAGSSAALSSVNNVLSSFQPDMAGSYVITLTVNDGFGGTASTNIQVQAFLNTQTVTEAIQSLEVIIGNQAVLMDTVFKNPNMRKTMTNKLNSVIANIEAKNYQEALAQLENDLLQKTDGFYGGNPKDDWIKTQEAQDELYPALVEIINNLKNLM